MGMVTEQALTLGNARIERIIKHVFLTDGIMMLTGAVGCLVLFNTTDF